MHNCEKCFNFKGECMLSRQMPPPRFHDGWCDSFEGLEEE